VALDVRSRVSVPTSALILDGLATTAERWRDLAVVWHVLAASLLTGLVVGWRPSRRFAGLLLATPLASVSVLAWASGNPFNGMMFAILTAVLAYFAIRLSRSVSRIGEVSLLVPGTLLITFGWVYPHFLQATTWTAYLYAAPLGLLPCPTLSAVLGVLLVLDLLDSRPLFIVLAAAGVLYGFIGAFHLGVSLDIILLAGALWTGFAALRLKKRTPLCVVRAGLPG
jgi:hypothetical protein